MKKINYLQVILFLTLFAACSGSKTYQGNWKATDSEGEKCEIFFEAKNFSVKDSTGVISKYTYTQNLAKVENSIRTYGITLGDGRSYEINFPMAKDQSIGLIKDANGILIYTISRNDYINYDDIYKLK
jgi:hypothetical protein